MSPVSSEDKQANLWEEGYKMRRASKMRVVS